MPTPVRALVVPAAAAILLVACSSSSATKTSSTAAVPHVTSTSPSPASTGDTEVADPGTIPGTQQEIVVHVGVDDAATKGSRVEKVKLGQQVVLRLTSDGDEDYHVHGYDLEQKVAAGVEAQFQFTADKAGRFEVESHVTNKVYVVLDVS